MPLKPYRRGGVWHYSGTVAGRRLRGSTRVSDKDIALQIIAKKEREAWKGHLYGPESVVTFAQAALKYRKAGKSQRFLARLEDYWKDTPIKLITAESVRLCAAELYPRAVAATRNRQVLVPTHAVVNYAARLGLCPTLRADRFRVETRERVPVTVEWAEAFCGHANPRLGALAWFMLLTGARITEALSVTWNDVDLGTARALIRQTKIGAERRAHLPAKLVAALANIDGEHRGRVFGYSSRSTARPQWQRAVARAGIAPLSFHCCRHGFATALLHQGIDPITVARLGGWKSAQHVLATYGHAMRDDTLADRIIGTPAAQSKRKPLAK
jgi:integrase